MLLWKECPVSGDYFTAHKYLIYFFIQREDAQNQFQQNLPGPLHLQWTPTLTPAMKMMRKMKAEKHTRREEQVCTNTLHLTLLYMFMIFR